MRTIAALLACTLLTGTASAETFVACAGSASDLANLLSTLSAAPGNSDANEIRIRVGTYHAPAGGWIGSVTTHHNLTIHGGYTDAGCTQQTNDASLTILDGNNASAVLTINTPLLPASDIEVSGLTFQHGRGSNAFESSAGGLKIGDPNPINGGKILVERNIFRNNSATGNGFSQAVGGLLAATDGNSLIVRGNLFVDNASPNAAALFVYSNNAIAVSNNTFSSNQPTDATQPVRVTMDYVSATAMNLSNNIFWGNTIGAGVFDLNLTAQFNGFAGATLVDNDIQLSTGTAVATTGTLHVDPQFASAGDFHLAASSPLIDAGVGTPSGSLSTLDLAGAPRIFGAAVDLGAYEFGAPAAGPPIRGGFSGNWFDPSAGQGGHGFQIEVLPDNSMLVIWFVFNPAGTQQNWIYLQGHYDPALSSVTLPAFLESGGRFPPNFDGSRITATPWGSLTLTFSDCNNGSAQWTSNAASAAAGYNDVSFPILHLTSIAGVACH